MIDKDSKSRQHRNQVYRGLVRTGIGESWNSKYKKCLNTANMTTYSTFD